MSLSMSLLLRTKPGLLVMGASQLEPACNNSSPTSFPLVTILVTKTGLIHDVITRTAGYRNCIPFPRQPATCPLYQKLGSIPARRLASFASQPNFSSSQLGLAPIATDCTAHDYRLYLSPH
jgi:hypothetical protein